MKAKPNYMYQDETLRAIAHLSRTCPGTLAEQDMHRGAADAEPVLVILDSAIRWIKAYRARFDSAPGSDYMARGEIFAILSGARALLNFDGACRMEGLRGTDSKDNGTLEALYWEACKLAGISGEDGSPIE